MKKEAELMNHASYAKTYFFFFSLINMCTRVVLVVDPALRKATTLAACLGALLTREYADSSCTVFSSRIAI